MIHWYAEPARKGGERNKKFQVKTHTNQSFHFLISVIDLLIPQKMVHFEIMAQGKGFRKASEMMHVLTRLLQQIVKKSLRSANAAEKTKTQRK